MTASHFIDERHNLYVGWVLGIALKHGLPFAPVCDDDGNYTDRLALTLRDDITITVVVPPPPDDWTLAPNDGSRS